MSESPAEVVVVGASFAGGEVPAYAPSRGLSESPVEPASMPLAEALAEQVGGLISHRAAYKTDTPIRTTRCSINFRTVGIGVPTNSSTPTQRTGRPDALSPTASPKTWACSEASQAQIGMKLDDTGWNTAWSGNYGFDYLIRATTTSSDSAETCETSKPTSPPSSTEPVPR
ncbi:hypothetical protein [Gordonia sp. KTR9]|uniref:hypothetical protein n=1 Tax=Gordonia sp. KTR9 TaxID=337191 RepID=UPI0011D25841|nr:hypothetical protein [Gordonia sp. KTR9]